jgi:hypothetical protein
MTGCVSGAAKVADLENLLREAGFAEVQIVTKPESGAIISACMPGAEGYVASATIEGRKPGARTCCGPSCCS